MKKQIKEKAKATKKVKAVAEKVKRKKVDYMSHMGGMPEYKQPELAPYRVIIVNVQSAEALHKFAKLVGQQITDKTRYVWYPELQAEVALDKRWSK